MKTIHFKLSDKYTLNEDLSLCLGYFDGLHKGHFTLFSRAISSKYKSGVLTFNFASNIMLKNKRHITSIEDKERILSEIGIDYLFVLDFDDEVKSLSPKDFIDKIVLALGAKEVIIGDDYKFGYKAQGNFETLINFSNNKYSVIKMEDLKIDDYKIGTSSIIKLIENGEIEKVTYMLGRNYQITGLVERGNNIGNKYGFPTANINLRNYVIPKNGVYATYIFIDGKKYLGFANIGYHPTIQELENPILEVHIFDYDDNLYDKYIKVSFVKYIREEMKFENMECLYNQLKKDYITAKEILINNGE